MPGVPRRASWSIGRSICLVKRYNRAQFIPLELITVGNSSLINNPLITDHSVTHISNNFDLLVLRFIEDVGVAEDLHERRACFTMAIEELDELL